MRRAHQLRAARIDDDELGALAQPLLICEPTTGWASVGLQPMIRTTSASVTESKSCVPADAPKGLAQAIAGRRMANAGACVDIIIAEAPRISFCTR